MARLWSVASTKSAKAAINPIREATETHYPEAIKQSKKDIYSLGIGIVLLARSIHVIMILSRCVGDPSVFGNLPPHPATVAAVQKVLVGGVSYSYGTSYGYQIAREAIAKQFSTPDRPLTHDVSV